MKKAVLTRVIWKFPFQIEDEFTLKIPEGSVVVHIAKQGDQPCMWVDCHPENELVECLFRVHGTGHANIAQDEFYLGTIQEEGGALVWHVFRVEEWVRFIKAGG